VHVYIDSEYDVITERSISMFYVFPCCILEVLAIFVIKILHISCNVGMLPFQLMSVCPFNDVGALLLSFRVASF
jgi:hypothetical protein